MITKQDTTVRENFVQGKTLCNKWKIIKLCHVKCHPPIINRIQYLKIALVTPTMRIDE